jgi:2-polyprenyl-3-methyl-5-hydroxy-6-metoxy-1,4-benzoquinol methylase
MGPVADSLALRCPVCLAERALPIFEKSGYEIVKCAACGLVFVANPPTDSDIQAMYSFSSGYHADLADRTSPANAKFTRTAKRYVRLLASYRDGGRILDVGCSAGVFLDEARTCGWETYGVELSDDTASVARTRGLNVVTGTLGDAKLPAKFFDVITLWDVLEHVRDPVGTLSLANELLVPGGILALSTPNVDGMFPRLSLRAARLTRRWPHPEPPYHLAQFSKKTIAHALHLARFEVLDIVDRRIPLDYTFGTSGHVLRSPKRTLFAVAFMPIALIGPIVNSGDQIDVIALKPA